MTKKISFEFDRADSTALLAELASVIAHDVRTPVRHIGQFLEFYERERDAGNTEQAETHLEVVKDSLAIVSEMLDGVITYARLGRGLEDPAVVNLRKIAGSAFERAQMALNREELTLIYLGEETVFGHEVRLQEMLVHLFENAMLHASRDDDLKVWMVVESTPAETRIQIRDNGLGISNGYESMIFDLFQKGKSAKGEGAGIGLSLARRIARLHGGDLFLDSEVSGDVEQTGAALVVVLPTEQANASKPVRVASEAHT